MIQLMVMLVGLLHKRCNPMEDQVCEKMLSLMMKCYQNQLLGSKSGVGCGHLYVISRFTGYLLYSYHIHMPIIYYEKSYIIVQRTYKRSKITYATLIIQMCAK